MVLQRLHSLHTLQCYIDYIHYIHYNHSGSGLMKKNTDIVDDFVAPPCAGELRLLYQHPDFLLIEKPSGLLSLSGKNPLNWDSVHYRLLQGRVLAVAGKADIDTSPPAVFPSSVFPRIAFPTATLVHRLDFGTSGIMLVALNKQANSALAKQFQARTVDKRYIALLEGHLAQDQGTIELPIARDSPNFPRQKICFDTGKPARSDYQVIERFAPPQHCRVRFTPETGRSHQLRIHSLALGHPILGCDLYRSETSEQLAPRLMLHAEELHFDDPNSGERIEGKSCCPF